MLSAFISVLGVSQIPIYYPLKGIKHGARMNQRVSENNYKQYLWGYLMFCPLYFCYYL